MIPNAVTSIGNRAFKGCTALQRVEIMLEGPDITIGDEAFMNCTSLTSLPVSNLHDGVLRLWLYHKTNIVSIGNSAFEGCTSLGNGNYFYIPDATITVGNRAFAECSTLTAVSVGLSVTSIGQEAFLNCTSLYGVVMRGIPPAIDSTTFSGCTNLTEIWVPNDLYTAYLTDANWSAFSAIIKAIPA
jgi:hypothetical protein